MWAGIFVLYSLTNLSVAPPDRVPRRRLHEHDQHEEQHGEDPPRDRRRAGARRHPEADDHRLALPTLSSMSVDLILTPGV